MLVLHAKSFPPLSHTILKQSMLDNTLKCAFFAQECFSRVWEPFISGWEDLLYIHPWQPLIKHVQYWCCYMLCSALLFPVCSAKPIDREQCFPTSNHLMEEDAPMKHCPCAGDLHCQHTGWASIHSWQNCVPFILCLCNFGLQFLIYGIVYI